MEDIRPPLQRTTKAHVSRPISVGRCHVQTAKDRFGQDGVRAIRDRERMNAGQPAQGAEQPFTWPGQTDDDDAAEPSIFRKVPTMQTMRHNLTALSQRWNLYFAAYQGRIFVYALQSGPKNSLPAEPNLQLKPPASNEARNVGGFIDRARPHCINHMITGFLGSEEIVLACYDDGDIVAYYTKPLARLIFQPPPEGGGEDDEQTGETKNTPSTAQKCALPEPFFKENVRKTAWGLAIHQKSRLIAVTTNHREITIFAFAMHVPTPHDQISARRWEPLNKVESRVRMRQRNWRIIIRFGMEADNLPNICFLENDKGLAEKVCVIDIKGSVWTADMWKPNEKPNRVKPFCTGDIKSEESYPQTSRGWGVMAFREEAFMTVNSVDDLIGMSGQKCVVKDPYEADKHPLLKMERSLENIPDNPCPPSSKTRTARQRRSIATPMLMGTVNGMGVNFQALLNSNEIDITLQAFPVLTPPPTLPTGTVPTPPPINLPVVDADSSDEEEDDDDDEEEEEEGDEEEPEPAPEPAPEPVSMPSMPSLEQLLGQNSGLSAETIAAVVAETQAASQMIQSLPPFFQYYTPAVATGYPSGTPLEESMVDVLFASQVPLASQPPSQPPPPAQPGVAQPAAAGPTHPAATAAANDSQTSPGNVDEASVIAATVQSVEAMQNEIPAPFQNAFSTLGQALNELEQAYVQFESSVSPPVPGQGSVLQPIPAPSNVSYPISSSGAVHAKPKLKGGPSRCRCTRCLHLSSMATIHKKEMEQQERLDMIYYPARGKIEPAPWNLQTRQEFARAFKGEARTSYASQAGAGERVSRYYILRAYEKDFEMWPLSQETDHNQPKEFMLSCSDALTCQFFGQSGISRWFRAASRLSMLVHIPEISLVALGSPTGRVLLATLTKMASPAMETNGSGRWKYEHGIRPESVLPTSTDERAHRKTPRPLYGLALAVIPDDLENPGGLLLPKRYRLMLHYQTHDIMSYEISRDSQSGRLLVV